MWSLCAFGLCIVNGMRRPLLYDVLEIPVTKSDCLRAEVSRTIECTEVPFDAAITEAAVYAGYVSLYFAGALLRGVA